MIATCPECRKRYRLPDDAVPLEGRSVRCTTCGHGWIQMPDGTSVAHPVSYSAPPDAETATAGPDVGRGQVVDGVPPLSVVETSWPVEAANDSAVANPAATAAQLSVPSHIADGPPREASLSAAMAAEPPIAAPVFATHAPAANEPGASPPNSRRPRRRRWLWLVALAFILTAAALAVVEFAPLNTFTPPRLGLPPVTLPMSDLGSIRLPKLTLPKLHVPAIDLPPLDLTRIPYVGAPLDRMVNPPPLPASPLRLTATGERHRLANGRVLLNVTGTLVNPTALPQAVPAIDAALLDPAGRAAFHWRIAPPVVELAPYHSVAIESVATNFPPDATVLRLRLKGH